VLVTDGQASGNRLSLSQAIETAVASRVVVHVVSQKSWWSSSIAAPSETFVKRLADETGGLFRVDDALSRQLWDKPARVFRDIVEAIHNTHEIRVQLEDISAGTHELKLETPVPGLLVHAPRRIRINTSRSQGDGK
jgi:hypothetical protein